MNPTKTELEILEAEIRSLVIEVETRVDTAVVALKQAQDVIGKLDELYVRVRNWNRDD